MSTNKSKNYGLHLWAPSDSFLRTEFNDNFTRIDEKLAANLNQVNKRIDALLVYGTYKGTGGTQHIVLGFRPKVVFLSIASGQVDNGGIVCGGTYIDLPNPTAKRCDIVDDGFNAWSQYTVHLNDADSTYFYLAIR